MCVHTHKSFIEFRAARLYGTTRVIILLWPTVQGGHPLKLVSVVILLNKLLNMSMYTNKFQYSGMDANDLEFE